MDQEGEGEAHLLEFPPIYTILLKLGLNFQSRFCIRMVKLLYHLTAFADTVSLVAIQV